MKNNKLNVIEVFRSVQGEGNEVGRITTFVRLGGCSFRCAFCDSKQTWEPGKHGEMLTPMELFERIESLQTDHVTITGGNPAIWQEQMQELLELLKSEGYLVAMETQGDIFRSWMNLVDNMVISPKNIDNLPITVEEYKQNIQTIITYRGSKSTIIKTPIFNYDDLEWVKQFVNFEGKYNVYLSVGNDWTDMTDTQQFRTLILDRYKLLIETVLQDKWFLDNGVSVLPQIHTLVWDNLSGV